MLTGAKQERKENKNFGAALARFKAQDDLGINNENSSKTISDTNSNASDPHSNTITCIKAVTQTKTGADSEEIACFSTSGDDGKLVIWTTAKGVDAKMRKLAI